MAFLKQFCLPRFSKMTNGMSRLIPSSCALCGIAGETLLCAACRHQYFDKIETRCQQCAIPLETHDGHLVCGECLSRQPGFDYTVVASSYSAPLDQLILALKFGHRLALSALFSDLLRDAVLGDAMRRTASANGTQQHLPEILCAVPLGPVRLSERGFNQSLEIAKLLAAQLGISIEAELLHRVRETARQSSLHPDDRQKNVRHAFSLNEQAIQRIQGKHIGVIDDVMTTGTTLHEIATLLKRFGAARVSNYVVARTPRH
ncbi:ComF family protein [soil metagenome]